MTPHPEVRRAPVSLDVGSGPHARRVDQPCDRPHRRVGLDPQGRHRACVADVVAPAPAFVQEHHVPVARPLDSLTFALKPGLQRQDLIPNRLRVRLQVAHQRKVRRVEPGLALELWVDAAHSRTLRRRRTFRRSGETAGVPPSPSAGVTGALAERRHSRTRPQGLPAPPSAASNSVRGSTTAPAWPRLCIRAAWSRSVSSSHSANDRRLSHAVPRARSRRCARRAQSRAVDGSPWVSERWAIQTHGSATTGHIAAASASWLAIASGSAARATPVRYARAASDSSASENVASPATNAGGVTASPVISSSAEVPKSHKPTAG